MELQSNFLTFTEVRLAKGKEGKPDRVYVNAVEGQGADASKFTFTAPGTAYDKLAAFQMRPAQFKAVVRPSVFSSVAEGARFASNNLSLEVVSFDVKPAAVAPA